ncbi:LacI family transcriptional regulator [Terriglobus albidus]|uniref:LacI family transcriptional regulator n=1 Tax=Terriglobus albidus TaxID=1592106 RepID=A0A5B9E9X5_9BACT|nr:LacI family DNA-binding transcriptional regulator [Terriglobus albidus]QEE28464.1 LacI family transcriptional regulator [Terriglobus albidus]
MSVSRPMGRVTLADVAKAAGVATMTVSRYLHGNPNISAATARKVKAAIDRLGYRPNYAARVLMGQPSKVIGLILPNLANPFFSLIAHCVQQAAHARGYLVWIAATNDDPSSDLELIERMHDHHVDGLLLASSPGSTIPLEKMGGIPTVAIDRPLRGAGVDFVTVDDRTAAREAVSHLLQHGYKRIAITGIDAQIRPIQERILGYQDAMHAAGLPALPYIRCDDAASAIQICKTLRSGKRPIEALFPLNGDTSVLFLEAFEELRISIPRDLAFFSYGDIPLSRAIRPRLSAVQQPIEAMAEQATLRLLEQIEQKTKPSRVRIKIPASLVIRESCGCKRKGEIKTIPSM